MKKSFAFAICMVMLFVTACGNAKTITVELPANATTGYSWTYEMDVQDVLVETAQEYVAQDSELMGAPGTQKYVFAAQNDGTVMITFTYKRPWEQAQSYEISQRTYKVEKGNITEVSVVSTKVD